MRREIPTEPPGPGPIFGRYLITRKTMEALGIETQGEFKTCEFPGDPDAGFPAAVVEFWSGRGGLILTEAQVLAAWKFETEGRLDDLGRRLDYLPAALT